MSSSDEEEADNFLLSKLFLFDREGTMARRLIDTKHDDGADEAYIRGIDEANSMIATK